jgi:flagellar assembly factor FliW
MIIDSQRFGSFDFNENSIIHFPEGLVGFPEERNFALLRVREGSRVAWLQSATNRILAFPVISIDALEIDPSYADKATRGSADGPYAVMAVLCAPGGAPATVNLLAPIIVNVATREGQQTFIPNDRFTTTERLMLRDDRESRMQDNASANNASAL